MNSSTLRRLAADHASLRTAGLPPHYVFPHTTSASLLPDDLTQLTVLLTGPQGTPYSKGLWRLFLKIPEDYPKNPPKAVFRTRIWHPNVEENTGAICVDTLKRDWQPKLTLRDVLVTVSCLLIQPNPDSALNATAGHFLQDDYDSFSRQARLMTSIHANIPSNFYSAAQAAKRRGEDEGLMASEAEDQSSKEEGKSVSSSGVAVKNLPQRIASTQSAPVPRHETYKGGQSSGDAEDDENSASKENDPVLSPSPILAQSPQKFTLAKRPLSDLPIEPEAPCLGPSEQNIANNPPQVSRCEAPDVLCKAPQLAERRQGGSFVDRDLPEAGTHGLADILSDGKGSDDLEPPTKRICLEEGKENASETRSLTSISQKSGVSINAAAKAGVPSSKAVSASGFSGAGSVKAKLKVGLRRL